MPCDQFAEPRELELNDVSGKKRTKKSDELKEQCEDSETEGKKHEVVFTLNVQKKQKSTVDKDACGKRKIKPKPKDSKKHYVNAVRVTDKPVKQKTAKKIA